MSATAPNRWTDLSARDPRRRPRGRLVLIDAAPLHPVACALLLMVVPACSRPEPRGDPVAAVEADPSPTQLFAHPGGCRRCHDKLTRNVPAAPPPETVCSTSGCHASFREVPRIVHGPVALGDCRLCHTPHSSVEPHLLTRPEERLCGFCHTRLLSCPSAHGSTAGCTSCHDAHGSDAPHLLRPSAVDRLGGD